MAALVTGVGAGAAFGAFADDVADALFGGVVGGLAGAGVGTGVGTAFCTIAAGLGAEVGAVTGVAALGGTAEDEGLVSTGLSITVVATTGGAALLASGVMADTAGASGAAFGIGAALSCGVLLLVAAIGVSITATGTDTFDGPAQPETNSADNIAATLGTNTENNFV